MVTRERDELARNFNIHITWLNIATHKFTQSWLKVLVFDNELGGTTYVVEYSFTKA